MEGQYSWLEELIRRSELPEYDSKCDKEEQTHPNPESRLQE
jgi:hypothetical protein